MAILLLLLRRVVGAMLQMPPPPPPLLLPSTLSCALVVLACNNRFDAIFVFLNLDSVLHFVSGVVLGRLLRPSPPLVDGGNLLAAAAIVVVVHGFNQFLALPSRPAHVSKGREKANNKGTYTWSVTGAAKWHKRRQTSQAPSCARISYTSDTIILIKLMVR
uniref:Uncharacterized protein n=1 Tax=Arundo donax TaxID=35708 RepID=A0A0A9E1H4_ARUDO